MCAMGDASRATRRPERTIAVPAQAAGANRAAEPTASGNPLVIRLQALLSERGDNRTAQIAAGNVFLVRVASAMLALGSQVLLARWMGRAEYGVFIYAWTWVVMIGSLSDMGLSSAARRFIPEYTERGERSHLRGFLRGSSRLAFGIACTISAAGAGTVYLLAPRLDPVSVAPLYLACATIPAWGLSQILSGIAQTYDWQNLALIPFYVVRQIAMTGLMGLAWWHGAPTGAVIAMTVAMVTSWIVTLWQGVWLRQRLKMKVERGAARHDVKAWLATALPIFVVESFYLLLTYVDILALEHLGSPQDVAVYFAGARLLGIVAFVYYAIAGATTHKFTQYHVSGDHARLRTFFGETARWTFWPSLALCVAILALGQPLLSLFGPGFDDGYSAMLILSVGMLARAAVGPAERLLNMLGDGKPCAAIYALAFAVNLALCIMLIPRLGIDGAAVATSTALCLESVLLYCTVRRRIVGGAKPAARTA
jgi:O-antigen/teichoic acid export membrane protein